MRGADLVPLDQSTGDGRWIHVQRGSTAEVARALGALSVSKEARPRVQAALRLLSGVSGQVSVVLDLRDAEVGHVGWVRRRGPSVETFTVLPWLILGAPGIEVRVLRHMHRKVKRSFGGDRVNTDDTRYTLDELWVRSQQGVVRRPFRRLGDLGAPELRRGGPEVPGWERELPSTAPGLGRGAGHVSFAAGLVTSAVLLLLIPFALNHLSAPTLESLPDELEVPQLTQPEVRAALAQEDVWSQRKGVAGSASLEHHERLRALRALVVDPTADLEVRLQGVVALMGREGPLGVTTAVVLDRQLDGQATAWGRRVAAGVSPADAALFERARRDAFAVRLQVLRGLLDHDDPRALLVARGGLASGGPVVLRRAWVQALGHAPTADPGLVQQLQRSLQDADPGVRGRAGWSLAQVSPTDAAPHLLSAFRRTAKRAHAHTREISENEVALMSLARALAAVGARDELRAEAEGHGLSARVRLLIDEL